MIERKGRSLSAVLFFLMLGWVTSSFSNPLPIEYISELGFTEAGFKLELYRFDMDTVLTGWSLSSMTDTAAFKSGIHWNGNEYTVVTPDNLIQPINLRNQGDMLSLISPDGDVVLILGFGDVQYSECAAPRRVGESISSYQTYFFYLDSSPTFGSANDSVNSMGYVEGTITDTTGLPIAGATVHIGYYRSNRETVTDSAGSFRIKSYAGKMIMRISAENYIQQDILNVQVWPDSTITFDAQMQSSISKIHTNLGISPTEIRLEPNYPNPFNTSTRVTYYLPERTYVTVGIFDLQGRLVQRIYRGKQDAGRYDVNWNAANVASGVYLFRVTTPKQVLQRKCTLLK